MKIHDSDARYLIAEHDSGKEPFEVIRHDRGEWARVTAYATIGEARGYVAKRSGK